MKFTHLIVLVVLAVFVAGCAGRKQVVIMETTAYCGCGKCCSWERGRWKYLKLNFWHRYVSAGKAEGKTYSGLTARGTKPREPVPGLFSMDSVEHPWMIPVRLIFFPWLLIPRDGTIAADTRYHAFGTRMYVPGWGWGVVQDRGGAIKGPTRLDLYCNSHKEALKWGRRKVPVTIEK